MQISGSEALLVETLRSRVSPSLSSLGPGVASLLTDDALVRFLRARDSSMEAAEEMLMACAHWRASYRPDLLRCAGGVRDELEKEKFVAMGTTKAGEPSFLIFAGRHDPSESPLESVVAAVVWMLELMEARMAAAGVDRCTILMDYQGWGYANMDNKMTQEVLQIIQNYYPERLGKAFMINTPWLFKGAWRVISPFLDANTRGKIVFTGSSYGAELLEYFDSDQLADSHGGSRVCAFDLNAFLAEEASYHPDEGPPGSPDPSTGDGQGNPAHSPDDAAAIDGLYARIESEVSAILAAKPKSSGPAPSRGCVSPSAMPLALVMRRYADEDLIASDGAFAETPRGDWTPRESANPIILPPRVRVAGVEFATDAFGSTGVRSSSTIALGGIRSLPAASSSSSSSSRKRGKPGSSPSRMVSRASTLAKSASRSVAKWLTRGPGLNLGQSPSSNPTRRSSSSHASSHASSSSQDEEVFDYGYTTAGGFTSAAEAFSPITTSTVRARRSLPPSTSTSTSTSAPVSRSSFRSDITDHTDGELTTYFDLDD